MRVGNLHREIPTELPEELFTTLAASSSVRIERIVSRGHRSPEGFWYDQEESEFVLVVSGSAELQFEDGATRILTPGDWLEIPAHTRHRVSSTATDRDTVWLAVFYAPRSEGPETP